jgi:hypothetical protein
MLYAGKSAASLIPQYRRAPVSDDDADLGWTATKAM